MEKDHNRNKKKSKFKKIIWSVAGLLVWGIIAFILKMNGIINIFDIIIISLFIFEAQVIIATFVFIKKEYDKAIKEYDNPK